MHGGARLTLSLPLPYRAGGVTDARPAALIGEGQMLDDLKEEGIVNKVGGRFKLSTLIQKRMIMLNQGARPLVDAKGLPDKMSIVIKEILEDKIYLGNSGEVQARGITPGEATRRAMLGDISSHMGADE